MALKMFEDHGVVDFRDGLWYINCPSSCPYVSHGLVDHKNFKERIQEAERVKKFAAGLNICDEAFRLHPESIEFRIQKAKFLVLLHKYEEAHSILDEVIRKFPKNVDALLVLGLAFYHQGNFKRCVEISSFVLRVNPMMVDMKLLKLKATRLMEIIETISKPESKMPCSFVTLRIISEGLKLDPTNRAVTKILKFCRAKINFKANYFSSVIKDLTDVLKIDQAHVDAFLLRAKSFYAFSMHEDAIVDLLEAERLDQSSKISKEIDALRRAIGRAFVPKTNYKLLDLSRNATHSEIVRSFESLSILHQVNLGRAETEAETRKCEFWFKRLENAYSILSDEKLKQQYDKALEDQESSISCSIM